MESTDLELYVVPVVGTVVTLQHAREAAQALADVRDLEQQLRDAKRVLTDALVEASKREGTKTLHFGDMDVEIAGGVDYVWDTEKLEQGLLALGCPQGLLDEIIRTEITVKVSANRAKRAATANPQYASVIAASRTEIEKPHTIVLRKS